MEQHLAALREYALLVNLSGERLSFRLFRKLEESGWQRELGLKDIILRKEEVHERETGEQRQLDTVHDNQRGRRIMHEREHEYN